MISLLSFFGSFFSLLLSFELPYGITFGSYLLAILSIPLLWSFIKSLFR